GKELWRSTTAAKGFVVAGALLVPTHGDAVLDAITGDAAGTLPEGRYGAGGDRIVGVVKSDLVEARCAARRCTTKKRARLTEGVSSPDQIVVMREGVFVVYSRHVIAFDRTNKQRLDLAMDYSSHPTVVPHGFAIADDSGVVLASLASCLEL